MWVRLHCTCVCECECVCEWYKLHSHAVSFFHFEAMWRPAILCKLCCVCDAKYHSPPLPNCRAWCKVLFPCKSCGVVTQKERQHINTLALVTLAETQGDSVTGNARIVRAECVDAVLTEKRQIRASWWEDKAKRRRSNIGGSFDKVSNIRSCLRFTRRREGGEFKHI